MSKFTAATERDEVIAHLHASMELYNEAKITHEKRKIAKFHHQQSAHTGSENAATFFATVLSSCKSYSTWMMPQNVERGLKIYGSYRFS